MVLLKEDFLVPVLGGPCVGLSLNVFPQPPAPRPKLANWIQSADGGGVGGGSGAWHLWVAQGATPTIKGYDCPVVYFTKELPCSQINGKLLFSYAW